MTFGLDVTLELYLALREEIHVAIIEGAFLFLLCPIFLD